MEKPKLLSKEDFRIENNVIITKKQISADFPLHWHDFFEIEFIVEGQGIQALNGKCMELKKGTAYLLTPNDFHEIYCNGTVTLFNIQFSTEMLEDEMLMQLSDPRNHFTCQLDESAYNEMLFLAEALNIGNTKHLSFKRNILSCILAIITDNASLLIDSHRISVMSNTVSKALLYMDINFKNNPTLHDVASYVGLNSSYFNRLFFRETKETPMHYLASLKLSYAKTLLLSTPLHVTEIAFLCGFGSFSNFSKAFKAHFHMSPNELRKNG